MFGEVVLLTKKERLFAIFKCAYFGILPYWVYEKTCHYRKNGEGCEVYTYLDHLKMNYYTARSLLRKTEHECTHEFHKSKCRYLRFQLER